MEGGGAKMMRDAKKLDRIGRLTINRTDGFENEWHVDDGILLISYIIHCLAVPYQPSKRGNWRLTIVQ